MNNYIDSRPQFIVGARNSGKSVYAENNISQYSSKIYLGTLWKEKKYALSIQMHQARRNSSWTLIESEGNIEKDIQIIGKTIEILQSPIACLIDGLMTWALNCARINGDIIYSGLKVANAVVSLVNLYPKIYWRIVDVNPGTFNHTYHQIHFKVCEMIHNILLTSLTEIKLIEWKREY
jgi:adenosyl cobinamide kinase/adenosyl cobinamide phosphate guanylyltransferase